MNYEYGLRNNSRYDSNGFIYHQPTFADRTPRRSRNLIAREDNFADRCASRLGVQKTLTGRYKTPLREKRGAVGLIASVLTMAIIVPIVVTSKVVNGVKDAFDDKGYDDDAYYDREYPDEVYKQKQNTRVMVYDDDNDDKQTNKFKDKVVATASVQLARKKQELLDKTREKIKNSAAKADVDTIFSVEDIPISEYSTYKLGQPISVNTPYQLSADMNIHLDLVSLVSESISTLHLREQCSQAVEAKDRKEAEKFLIIYNKAIGSLALYRTNILSSKFVKITYKIELYKNGELVQTDEMTKQEFASLKASQLYIQVPTGYEVKLKFFIS